MRVLEVTERKIEEEDDDETDWRGGKNKQTNGNNKKKLKEWMNEWATEIIPNTITNWNNSSNVSYISLFYQALVTIVLLKSPCHTGWLWFSCENFSECFVFVPIQAGYFSDGYQWHDQMNWLLQSI